MQHLCLSECPERRVQKSAKQKRIFTVSSCKLWVRVCIAPLFLLHLKTLLGSGLFQGFLPFFPSSKSCHGHLPKHSDSISSTVNFSFSGVSENNNCCKKTNSRHAAYAAHNVNLLLFLKKKNCSMKSRGQISDPVKFMAQCQFIWKNHTFVPKFYKSLTTICFLTCYSPLRWYSFFGISNYHYCCCCYYSRKSVWEERWNLV